jgi:hypothetical protein
MRHGRWASRRGIAWWWCCGVIMDRCAGPPGTSQPATRSAQSANAQAREHAAARGVRGIRGCRWDL